MCESCDPTVRKAAAFVATRVSILKAAGVPELVEIAVREVELREALLAAHRRAAQAAVDRAVAIVESRPGTEATARAVEQAIAATYPVLLQKPARAALEEHVPEFYRLGRIVAWRRALGLIKTPLVYEVSEGEAQVSKAGAKGTRVAQVNPAFDVVDEAAQAALVDHQVFWIGEHYEDNLSARIAATSRDVLVSRGLGGADGGRALRAALDREFGLVPGPTGLGPGVPVPEGWRGSPTAYFHGVAANAATTGRVFGSTRSFEQLGVSRLTINNPSDERTCLRCRVMDGKSFPVHIAADRMRSILAARTKAQVRAAHPWKSEKWFKGRAAGPVGAQDEAELIQAGVVLPGYHLSCRCTVDIAEGATINPPMGDDVPPPPPPPPPPPVELPPIPALPTVEEHRAMLRARFGISDARAEITDGDVRNMILETHHQTNLIRREIAHGRGKTPGIGWTAASEKTRPVYNGLREALEASNGGAPGIAIRGLDEALDELEAVVGEGRLPKALKDVRAKLTRLRNSDLPTGEQLDAIEDYLQARRDEAIEALREMRAARVRVDATSYPGGMGRLEETEEAIKAREFSESIVAGLSEDKGVVLSYRPPDPGKYAGRGYHTPEGRDATGRRVHAIHLPPERHGDSFASVLSHEVSHVIEYHAAEVSKAAHAFRAEVGIRSKGKVVRAKLQKLNPGCGYKADEEAIVGGYFDNYAGKDYDFRMGDQVVEKPATEIVTMGLEFLYRFDGRSPDHGRVRRAGHFDHFALIDWIVEVAIQRGRAFVP